MPATVVIQGVTVDEDELGVGEVNGSLTQSGLLQVTGTDNHVGASVHSGLHGLVAVVISGLIAAGGLVILVAQAIGGGVELHAVICTLVEALVLQLAHIGDEGNLVLAILAGHAVGDIVGVGDSGGVPAGGLLAALVGLGVIAGIAGVVLRGVVGLVAGGVVPAVAAAGHQGDHHRHGQQQRQ